MYFLSMKIADNNNGIPLMSEHDNDVAKLVGMAENVFELLTRHSSWDRAVIDNNFDTKSMSDAGMDLINGKIMDFEWKFFDKFDREIRCYITANI